MLSELEKLQQLVPPPLHPIHGEGASWHEIQQSYGGRLPACLQDYGRIYGSGEFKGGRGIVVFNPYDPAFESNIVVLSKIYQELRSDSPEFYPYAWYPEPGGLIPAAWGPGALVFIDPGDSPEAAKIVFENPSRDFVEYPKMTLLEFLYDFVSNKIEEAFFYEKVVFEPGALIPRKDKVYGEP